MTAASNSNARRSHCHPEPRAVASCIANCCCTFATSAAAAALHCHHADDSLLLVLNLRGNQLSGNATIVESCGNLVTLDVSHNDFTGPMPASEHWDELASYRTSHNRLSGKFPAKLATSARILEVGAHSPTKKQHYSNCNTSSH
jgi:hypothetical protein